MKTQLLLPIILFLLFSSLSAAPIEKGSASLGITGAFADSDSLDTTLASFDYSYLAMDNIGLRLGVDYLELGLDDGTDSADLTTWIAGLGADFYFTQEGGNWATYIGASLLYIDQELESTALSSDLSGDETGFEARVGIIYFITEAVAFDTRLRYLDIDDFDVTGISFGLALWF